MNSLYSGVLWAITFFLSNFLISAEMTSFSFGDKGFKGCVCYIFASLFLHLKKSTSEARKNVFYFTSKALFVLEIIKF